MTSQQLRIRARWAEAFAHWMYCTSSASPRMRPAEKLAYYWWKGWERALEKSLRPVAQRELWGVRG